MSETRPNDYSSWAVGWAGFAGVMLIILGVLDVIQGLTALFNDTFYVATRTGEGEGWIFEFDVTTWGWIHLIGGIILVLAGVGIFSGNVAARVVGVIVASLAALWNFAWLPYYPIWSIILIAVAIAVIWALTAHGRDITYND
jgi:hypothetical protein